MNLSIINASGPDDAWGPYTDPALLERSLKIARMALDDELEVIERQADPWSEPILEGLLPWRVEVYLDRDGGLDECVCRLCWPPEEEEGLLSGTAHEGSDNPSRIDFFVWAKNERAAKIRLAKLKAVKELKK